MVVVESTLFLLSVTSVTSSPPMSCILSWLLVDRFTCSSFLWRFCAYMYLIESRCIFRHSDGASPSVVYSAKVLRMHLLIKIQFNSVIVIITLSRPRRKVVVTLRGYNRCTLTYALYRRAERINRSQRIDRTSRKRRQFLIEQSMRGNR